MSPTAKILLGAGATGIAGYLLWRLWPKDVPPVVVVTTPGYTPVPVTPVPVTPALATPPPQIPTYIPPAALRTPQTVCPLGTYLDEATGTCVPYTIE